MHEHSPLTPRAASRLLKEALGNMNAYRRELGVFSRFIERHGQAPFNDARALDPIRTKKRELRPAPRGEEQEEEEW